MELFRQSNHIRPQKLGAPHPLDIKSLSSKASGCSFCLEWSPHVATLHGPMSSSSGLWISVTGKLLSISPVHCQVSCFQPCPTHVDINFFSLLLQRSELEVINTISKGNFPELCQKTSHKFLMSHSPEVNPCSHPWTYHCPANEDIMTSIGLD